MKKVITLFLLFMVFSTSIGQTIKDSIQSSPKNQINSAQRILSGNAGKAITIGGYAQLDYNQPEGSNGEIDVHRLVILFGYKFNDKTQFVTEIEYEHVNEVFVEQAFVNYSIGNNISLRGGLMLVPFGIINEFHEPTTFNGVERPNLDGFIVPTTWRELGIGVNGKFNDISLGYQAYIFNGFKPADEDGNPLLTGINGFRGGRQKGIRSVVNSPTFAVKLDYYGVQGLRLGLSTYLGDTQADDEVEDLEGANVGIAMVGLDARYRKQRFSARGQFVYASISDSKEYNILYSDANSNLGSAMLGWYVEGAYNLLSLSKDQKLDIFARFENYNTHFNTDGIEKNKAYNRYDLTTGLSYHIAPGVVVKGDYQFKDNEGQKYEDVANQLNLGIGVWF